MNKKPNKNRTGLLIGIGSIFLTITVAGVILTSQISKHHSMHDSGNGMNQTMEDIFSETNADERDDYLLDDEENDVDDATENASEPEEVLERIRYSPDGRAYTPYVSVSDWESATEEERWAYTRTTIPVLQDWNMTIDSICMDSLIRSSRSYILGRQLYSWCEKEGIKACEGEYLAYCSYIGQGKESFYVELDDDERTVIICQSISHGLYWKFSYCQESEEYLEQLREQEQKDR